MDSTNSLKRENYRLQVRIKVFYCLDSPQARNAMLTDYAVWSAQPPALGDPLEQAIKDMNLLPQGLKPICTMLQWLNFKMDVLLYQMRLTSRESIFSKFLTTSDLSLQGFGFTETIMEAQPGDPLLLALHLPDDPVHPLYAVGALLRNQTPENDQQSLGAITFTEIAEADQERIARFIFDQQRRLKQSAHDAPPSVRR